MCNAKCAKDGNCKFYLRIIMCNYLFKQDIMYFLKCLSCVQRGLQPADYCEGGKKTLSERCTVRAKGVITPMVLY